jgi:hypothetical protein
MCFAIQQGMDVFCESQRLFNKTILCLGDFMQILRRNLLKLFCRSPD